MACVEDTDCNATLVCFSGVSWRPGPAFCSCNTFFGWQGEDAGCTEWGPTTYYLAVTLSLQLVLALVLLALAAKDLSVLARYFRKGLNNAAMRTQILLVSALASFVAWRATYMASVVTPKLADVVLTTVLGDMVKVRKIGRFNLAARFLIVLTETLTVLTCSSISIVWLERAAAASKMALRIPEPHVGAYRRAVSIYSVLFFLSISAVVIPGYNSLSAIVALPFVLVLLATFVAGQRKLRRILTEFATALGMDLGDSGPGNPRRASPPSPVGLQARIARQQLTSIRTATTEVLVSFTVLLVGGAAYFVLRSVHPAGWKEFAPYGKIAAVTVVGELLPLVLLGLLGCVLKYCRRNRNGLLNKSRRLQSERSWPQLALAPTDETHTSDRATDSEMLPASGHGWKILS